MTARCTVVTVRAFSETGREGEIEVQWEVPAWSLHSHSDIITLGNFSYCQHLRYHSWDSSITRLEISNQTIMTFLI